MKLYSYFRSSAAYRVRIALALKGLSADIVPVHLLNQGGEHKLPQYRALNPQALLPSLVDDGQIFTQSLSIMEYLEERYPDVPLLPSDVMARARVRAMCQVIACDTHPLNNLRVLSYLTNTLSVGEAEKQAWYAHWIQLNFAALEALLVTHAGRYCYGDTPTMADCCLVPQLYNARRFNIDLSAYPTLVGVGAACETLSAFIAAHPDNQPDAR